VHPMIQSAAAAQHVKDMLDQAAEDGRAREARRARRSRRGRHHAVQVVESRATRRDLAPTQCAD
jgi:hypothetical protein